MPETTPPATTTWADRVREEQIGRAEDAEWFSEYRSQRLLELNRLITFLDNPANQAVVGDVQWALLQRQRELMTATTDALQNVVSNLFDHAKLLGQRLA